MSVAAQPPESGIVPSRVDAYPSSVAQAHRRRAFRALVGLVGARLRKAPIVRLGRFLAVFIGVASAAVIIGFRAVDGAGAPVEGFVVGAARWSAWLGAGAVALGASNQRTLVDRRDGLEILAFARGTSSRALGSARVIAAGIAATRAICLPALIASIAALACAGSAHSVVARLALTAVLMIFGVIAGLALAMVSTFADRARPSGGRGLFVTLVLVPWALLDLLGRGTFSIPGALGAVLSLGLDAVGLGRLS